MTRAIVCNEEGLSLVVVILALLLLATLGVAVLTGTAIELRSAVTQQDHDAALYVAEAGIERGIQALIELYGDPDASSTTDNATFQFARQSIDGGSTTTFYPDDFTQENAFAWDDDTVDLNDQQQLELWDLPGLNTNLITDETLIDGDVRVDIRAHTASSDGGFELAYCVDDPAGTCSSAGAWNPPTARQELTATAARYPFDLSDNETWTLDDLRALHLRVTAVENTGNDPVAIDYVAVRITRRIAGQLSAAAISALGGAWDTDGQHIILGPYSLGDDRAVSVKIPVSPADDKLNANYALTVVLENLIDIACGSPSNADDLAAGIVAGRPHANLAGVEQAMLAIDSGCGDCFDSIEPSLTLASWTTTVYHNGGESSGFHTDTDTAAMVNLNAAATTVLQAIFSSQIGDNDAAALAWELYQEIHETDSGYQDLYAGTGPFACIYATDPQIRSVSNFLATIAGEYIGPSGSRELLANSDMEAVMELIDPTKLVFKSLINTADESTNPLYTFARSTDDTTGAAQSYYITAQATVGASNPVTRTIGRAVQLYDDAGTTRARFTIRQDPSDPASDTTHSWTELDNDDF